MWLGISLPLIMIGSFFGYKQPVVEDPVRTNQIPRCVPPQVNYTNFISFDPFWFMFRVLQAGKRNFERGQKRSEMIFVGLKMIIFGHFSRFLASFKISFSSLQHPIHVLQKKNISSITKSTNRIKLFNECVFRVYTWDRLCRY